MRRPFGIPTAALALALLPAAVFAQTPAPAAQPPAQQPAGAQPPPPQPTAPKVVFTTPAGMLLVQIKPAETAAFEEMVKKLNAGFAKTTDDTLKQQASGLKVFKVTEPFNNNVLYIVTVEPTIPNAEYELFAMLQKTMTDDEKRAPETAEMWKRFIAAFAGGLSKLSLTPVK